MQNAFIQMRGDQIIIDKAQLTTYAIAAAATLVVIVLLTVVIKRRKKSFIKTIPTNLKAEA